MRLTSTFLLNRITSLGYRVFFKTIFSNVKNVAILKGLKNVTTYSKII